MIEAEFQPTLFPVPDVAYTDNPYVKVEIQRRDPTNIYRSPCIYWDRSSTNLFQEKYKGSEIVGLHPGRSLTSATLEKDIPIDKAGWYWILLRVVKTPGSTTQTIGLSIDGDLLQNIRTYAKWEYYRFLDFGYVYLTAGTHTFLSSLSGKRTWVDHLLMYRLEYFSSDELDSEHRLDWKSIEFTENCLGDLNSAEIALPLREIWNDPNANIYSRKYFDFGDILNIIVGSSNEWSNAHVKFGGYVLGCDVSDDSSELIINGVDRLIDLYRRPSYTNYYINLSPTSDETYTFPVRKFATVFEAIRSASETCEYGPLNYGIDYPYSLDLDFRLLEDYEKTSAIGFDSTYSPTMGIRLGYGKSTGACSLILFDDEYGPIDASVEDILCLKYLAAGESCTVNNRMQFNIKVTMYKNGESTADAKTYTILFTGKSGDTNIIGQALPVFDGNDQLVKFDWNEAFDDYAPSSHYYVTKIEVTDTATSSQISRRERSNVYIQGLITYDSDFNTKMKVNQETSYPYEDVKEMIDNINYVAYLDYGRERREDVLCVSPLMNEVCPIEAVEGVNVRKVTDISYAPRDILHNRILAHYHYKKGNTEKTGISYYENLDSVARYGPGAWETYEDLTDISTKKDADLYCKKYIEENSYPMTSFTLIIDGTSLLNPSQYIVSKLQKNYLVGEYSTKTAVHNISQEEGYTTSISVNRPGSYYEEIMDKLERNINKYIIGNSENMYNQTVLANMGFSSLGAFIRSGY
jgi:hypothetical protein